MTENYLQACAEKDDCGAETIAGYPDIITENHPTYISVGYSLKLTRRNGTNRPQFVTNIALSLICKKKFAKSMSHPG